MFYVSPKDTVEIIQKLERPELTSLKIQGIYIWPVIRYHIVSALWNEEATSNQYQPLKAELKKSILSLTKRAVFKKKIFYLFYRVKLKVASLSLRKKNLFMCRKGEASVEYQGHRHSSLYLGIRELFFDLNFEIGELCLEKELIEKSFSHLFPVVRAKVFADMQAEKFEDNLFSILNEDERKKYRFDIEWILNDISTIIAHRDIFIHLLKGSKVKNVFYTVFFHPKSLAIALAARSTGIVATELQHGQDGAFSPLDSQFRWQPPGGYELLPHIFWQWTEQSLLNKKCFFDNHRVFNFNNPAAYFFKRYSNFQNVGQAGTKKILFATQPAKDPFPDFILKCIKNPELKNFEWIVRIHPAQKDQKLDIQRVFSGCSNVVVGDSAQFSLGDLLKNCHFIVSGWSTVLFEGQIFGKLGIAIDPLAIEQYPNELKDRDLIYASSEAELESLLLNPESVSCRSSIYESRAWEDVKSDLSKAYG